MLVNELLNFHLTNIVINKEKIKNIMSNVAIGRGTNRQSNSQESSKT